MDLICSAKTAQSTTIISSTSKIYEPYQDGNSSTSIGNHNGFCLDNFSSSKKNTTYSVPFGSPLKEQIQRKAKLLTSVYQGQDLCCHLGHLAWAFTASDL